MNTDSKIYVAGHTGMVGSAIVRMLRVRGFTNIITRTRQELELTNQRGVIQFFQQERPEYVFMAAANVGGILANRDYPATFLIDNLAMELNVLGGAANVDAKKLLFLGSSCIYPKLCAQPITEDALLTGPLEPTNEWYALAKIAGVKMCQALRRQHGLNFISAMPCNLYGPGDNYHPGHSHVIPGMIQRFHQAKKECAPKVECWGTGLALREFLFVDDLAEACLCLMNHYNEAAPINVGSGEEISVWELAREVAVAVEYWGEIAWDASKPDGTPRKLLDSSRIRGLGWAPAVSLREGLKRAYGEFVKRDA